MFEHGLAAKDACRHVHASTLLRRWSELAKNASRTAEGIKQLSAWAANMTQFVQQLVTVALVVAGAAASEDSVGEVLVLISAPRLQKRWYTPSPKHAAISRSMIPGIEWYA